MEQLIEQLESAYGLSELEAQSIIETVVVFYKRKTKFYAHFPVKPNNSKKINEASKYTSIIKRGLMQKQKPF